MQDNSQQSRDCCPKEISRKEVKLWGTAHLRYKEKPKSHRINGKFERDIKSYKAIINSYVNEFNKKYNVTLRVAFVRQDMDFAGDPYVKLSMYLEFTEPSRFYGKSKSRHGIGARSISSGPETNEAANLEATGEENLPATGEGNLQNSESEDLQNTAGMEATADLAAAGPGTVTPPRCPPDHPNLSVAEVASTECSFQQ